MGLIAHGSELAKVEYSNDNGANWIRIPGCNSYAETGGEAPERDVVAFEGSSKLSGATRVPSVDVNGIYTPLHPAWRQMRALMISKESALFRLVTKERVSWKANANVEAAIDAGGVVAFSGAGEAPNLSDPRFGSGQVLRMPGNDPLDFVVDEIEGKPLVMSVQAYEPTTALVSPVANAVAALDSFTIRLSALTRTFEATVRLTSRGSLGVGITTHHTPEFDSVRGDS